MRIVNQEYVDTRIDYIKKMIADQKALISKLDYNKCGYDDPRLTASSPASGLIVAEAAQAVRFESTPTFQSITVQILGAPTDFRTLKIWRGNGTYISIPDAGCSVTAEEPFTMVGSVLALNANLQQLQVRVSNSPFNSSQANIIKIGVDNEEKEIIINPVAKSW